MGYLDNDGLSYLWGKIKAALAKKQDPLLSSGASVGQAVIIKTVDADGKPTQWEAKTLSEEVFTVHFTAKRQLGSGPILTSDKTPEEVLNAISEKKQIVAFFNNKQLCNIEADSTGLHFFNIDKSGTMSGVGWDIDDDMSGEETYTLTEVHPGTFLRYTGLQGTYQIFGTGETGSLEFKPHIEFINLPEVAASDNGKFMRVVNGAWAASSISDANGVSF